MVKTQLSNCHKSWELVTVTDRLGSGSYTAHSVQRLYRPKNTISKPTRISLQKQNHTERESDKIDKKYRDQQRSHKYNNNFLLNYAPGHCMTLTLTIPGEDKETKQDPKSGKQVTRSVRVVKTPELQKQVGSLGTSLLIKEKYLDYIQF